MGCVESVLPVLPACKLADAFVVARGPHSPALLSTACTDFGLWHGRSTLASMADHQIVNVSSQVLITANLITRILQA